MRWYLCTAKPGLRAFCICSYHRNDSQLFVLINHEKWLTYNHFPQQYQPRKQSQPSKQVSTSLRHQWALCTPSSLLNLCVMELQAQGMVPLLHLYLQTTSSPAQMHLWIYLKKRRKKFNSTVSSYAVYNVFAFPDHQPLLWLALCRPNLAVQSSSNAHTGDSSSNIKRNKPARKASRWNTKFLCNCKPPCFVNSFLMSIIYSHSCLRRHASK